MKVNFPVKVDPFLSAFFFMNVFYLFLRVLCTFLLYVYPYSCPRTIHIRRVWSFMLHFFSFHCALPADAGARSSVHITVVCAFAFVGVEYALVVKSERAAA